MTTVGVQKRQKTNAMATYTKLSIRATEEQGDILTAYLSDFPFESFDYSEEMLNAYIPQSQLAEYRDAIEEVLQDEGILDFFFEEIESQNWNAKYQERKLCLEPRPQRASR